MSGDGALTVQLAWDGQSVRTARIESARPFAIGALLRDRTPAEVRAVLPRLYSICAVAQGEAATLALAAAAGSPDADPDTAPYPAGNSVAAADAPAQTDLDAGAPRMRATRVALETVQEHVWRLMLDWPAALGLSGQADVVARARRLCAPWLGGSDPVTGLADAVGELAALAATDIFGQPITAWHAIDDPTTLARWAAAGTTLPARCLAELAARGPRLGWSPVALMPEPTPARLRADVLPGLRADPAFARAPRWNGAPVETGPLARRHDHPLVAALYRRDGATAATRLVARLVDLAAVLVDLATVAADIGREPVDLTAVPITLAAGEGLGAVTTARGLLLHRVLLVAGRVAEYDVVAPTEWNFHPDGPLAQGLRGLAATDPAALVRAARVAVVALDPCVACQVEVSDA